jgi:hypothetical protein
VVNPWGVRWRPVWDAGIPMDRDLLEADEEVDIVGWSLRLQALAELRALAGAEDRPEFPGVIRRHQV